MAGRRIRVNNRDTGENTKTHEAGQKTRVNNRETGEQPSGSRKVKEDDLSNLEWVMMTKVIN